VKIINENRDGFPPFLEGFFLYTKLYSTTLYFILVILKSSVGFTDIRDSKLEVYFPKVRE
tara:strand:+ start:321 stop:500 length:180 start_codon:yes stop_codon:yes gene_type:complete